jgi:hypothetical protein
MLGTQPGRGDGCVERHSTATLESQLHLQVVTMVHLHRLLSETLASGSTLQNQFSDIDTWMMHVVESYGDDELQRFLLFLISIIQISNL